MAERAASRSTRCLAIALALAAAAAIGAPAVPARSAAIPTATVHGFESVHPQFEQVGDAESVPDNNVNAIAQDASGFLWLGTTSGVIRYDGYSFRRYNHDPREADSLVDNFVRSLAASDDGGMWIGAQNGLSRFDPRSGKFTNFRHVPGDPDTIPAGPVRSLLVASDRALWVVADIGGLARRDPESGAFTAIALSGAAGETRLGSCLLQDRSGRIWVGTRAGLVRMDARDQAIVAHAGTDAASTLLRETWITALFQASDGRIWVGTRQGAVISFDPDAADAAPRLIDQGRDTEYLVNAFAEGNADSVWVGRTIGLELRELSGAPVDLNSGRVGLRSSPSSVEIRALLRDAAGFIWAGGYGSGLRRLAPLNPAIRVVLPGLALGSPVANVGSILPRRDGRFWVGWRPKGIAILDSQFRMVGGYYQGAEYTPGFDVTWVSSLAESADGGVWVGHGSGVLRLEPGATNFTSIGTAPELNLVNVRRILSVEDGTTYFGTDTGLFRAEPGSNRITRIDLADGRSFGTAINALSLDAERRLWVGSRGGLYVLLDGADALKTVRARDAKASLPNDITGLLLDSSQRFWIDSSVGLFRLLRYDGEFAEFDAVSHRLGIRSLDFGANLLEDERGRIWTHRHVYDPATESVYELTRADGVDIGTGWFRSYAKAADGRLLFGGSEGLLVVDPERFEPWNYQPPLVVTELRIDGRARAFARDSRVLMQPGERSISVEFAALDYSAPQRLRYEFRLEGYDDHWSTTDARNRITGYSNLWPGDYTLLVRGSNRTGAFSAHELRVPIRVLPLFWQTPWFAALAAFAALALVYGGVRLRLHHLRGQKQRLEQLVGQRTQELESSKRELEDAHHRVTASHARLINTQQQLVEHEKMAALGTLTAGVAHEINNPTNFADGAVQTLQTELPKLHEFLVHLAGDEAAPEVMQAIAERFARLDEMTATAREGHERIKRIVRDLRQFTRLDEAEFKSVPIAEPIQSTINLIRTRFDRIRFELNLGFNPEIACQPAKLGQVFLNLLMNACESIADCADGRNGVVSVTTSAADDAVRVEIADNGHGMDEATRLRVFEPFFTTKPVGAGTGLGLAIVFGIIKDHGGTIDVRSSPGQGTRFSLLLPLFRSAPFTESNA